MPSRTIYSALLALLLLSCDQRNDPTTKLVDTQPGTCGIRVKVIHHFCSYIFIQILDEQYAALGDDDFEMGGKNYLHVFQLLNTCELGKSLTDNQLWDKEFEVTVVNDYKEDCAMCLGGYAGKLPNSKRAVRLCVSRED